MSKRQSTKQSQKAPSKKGKDSKKSLNGPDIKISEDLRLAKQKQLIETLNRENVHKYLREHLVTPNSNVIASRVINESEEVFQWHFMSGDIDMPEEPLPLPDLHSKQQPKLSQNQLREIQLKAKRQQLLKKVQYLNEQTRPENLIRDQSSSHVLPSNLKVQLSRVILSKEQHEQKVRQIVQQWAQQKKRQEELLEEEQKRIKQEQAREEELRKMQRQKERQRKRSCIELNMKKRKAQHERLLENEKELQKKLLAVKSRQKLFEKMQHRYQSEIMMPSLQQKKNKLKQLREFHKDYQIQAIKEHQQQYMARLQERTKMLAKKEHEEAQNTHDLVAGTYRHPSRSQRLSKLLLQQALDIKRKVQSRKLRNEQMSRRLSLFQKEVLSKHKPKIDTQKKEQIMQRYYQQEKKNQRIRQSLDAKKIGMNYLEIAKKMKRSQSQMKQKEGVRTLDEKKADNKNHERSRVTTGHPNLQLSRAQNRSQDYYQTLRRKKIQQIMNSEENSIQQKYQMLSFQADKLKQKLHQKSELMKFGVINDDIQQETAELLLSSIKAKMGLMNVLKKGSGNNQDR